MGHELHADPRRAVGKYLCPQILQGDRQAGNDLGQHQIHAPYAPLHPLKDGFRQQRRTAERDRHPAGRLPRCKAKGHGQSIQADAPGVGRVYNKKLLPAIGTQPGHDLFFYRIRCFLRQQCLKGFTEEKGCSLGIRQFTSHQRIYQSRPFTAYKGFTPCFRAERLFLPGFQQHLHAAASVPGKTFSIDQNAAVPRYPSLFFAPVCLFLFQLQGIYGSRFLLFLPQPKGKGKGRIGSVYMYVFPQPSRDALPGQSQFQ